jgi:hypothetical protein
MRCSRRQKNEQLETIKNNNMKISLAGSMARFSIMLALTFCITLAASAQEAGGEASLGARFGGSSGISFKKYSRSNTSAFEVIAGWNFDNKMQGVTTTVLFEKLAPLSGKRLSAIFGIGPGFNFTDPFRFGAAGIIGFDWRVSHVINIQLDWQPTWYFTHGSEFTPVNAGFTVRYVLNHKKLKKG